MPNSIFETSTAYASAGRPHVSEWFGHRVFPVVSGSPAALSDQKAHRCPFLSQALGSPQRCVKSSEDDPAKRNSAGVCTISSTSNGSRQDWLVCPFRALDNRLMRQMVRRLFSIGESVHVVVRPAPVLDSPSERDALIAEVGRGETRVFVYFQGKLGGEIGLPKTSGSPAMSFDVTVVELLPGQEGLYPSMQSVSLGKYGVIELQTTDTHGTYKQTVDALTNALNLHPEDFHHQLSENPQWAGKRVEGPNVSNVFKRTFYQVAFKFQATKRESSVGCILVLPKPVWDSWRPFLGDPEIVEQADGTQRLWDGSGSDPSDWIYVFDVANLPGEAGSPAPLAVELVIGTDAATLSKAALDIAPQKAVAGQGSQDAVLTALHRRLKTNLPGLGF